jgi:hypothetical protein
MIQTGKLFVCLFILLFFDALSTVDVTDCQMISNNERIGKAMGWSDRGLFHVTVKEFA